MSVISWSPGRPFGIARSRWTGEIPTPTIRACLNAQASHRNRKTPSSSPALIADIADRLANRVQITTDGNRVYIDAIEAHMGGLVDYGMLFKQYGQNENPERAYSPAKCLGAKKRQIDGNPDMALVSTSYAERQNLNIRMGNRRYTRLTSAFSKKAEMLAYIVAITFMYNNFVRVHQTLKTTPAVKAGIAKHKWTIDDMVDLLPLNLPGKRGPYKPRKPISN